MELETINRLYLELSQVATAKTARELRLAESDKRRGKLLADIFNDPETELRRDLNSRLSDELMNLVPATATEGRKDA